MKPLIVAAILAALIAALMAALMATPAAHAEQGRDPAPPRDTAKADATPKSMSIAGDRASATPKPDFYAVDGGFDEVSQTNWALVVANKGKAPAAATNVAFYLKLKNGTETTGVAPLPALGANQSYELVMNSLIPTSLIETLFAHIDRPASVDESDETNNKFIFKDDRSGERAPYYKITMKNVVVDLDDRALRKRPGRTTYGDAAPPKTTGTDDHSAGDEHEIEYDVAAGSIIADAEPSPRDAGSGLAAGKRQHKPFTGAKNLPAGDAIADSGAPTGPLITCSEDKPSVWGCNCSTTNAVICAESLKAVGCKTIKSGGLANPDLYEYSCSADHSDQ